MDKVYAHTKYRANEAKITSKFIFQHRQDSIEK